MRLLIYRVLGTGIEQIWVWWCAGFIFFPLWLLPIILVAAIIYPSHFIEYQGQWYAKSDWLWANYPTNHHIDWWYTTCYAFVVCSWVWFITACAYRKPLLERRRQYQAGINVAGGSPVSASTDSHA